MGIREPERASPAIVAIIPGYTMMASWCWWSNIGHRLNPMVIELPAGLAGDGRDFDTKPSKQLPGESCWKKLVTKQRIHHLRRRECTASAGITDELMSIFLATGLNKAGPGARRWQRSKSPCTKYRLDDLVSWLDQQASRGAMIDLKVYAAIHFAKASRVDIISHIPSRRYCSHQIRSSILPGSNFGTVR